MAGSESQRWTASQSTTLAAPTLESQGISLRNVKGFRVSVDAGSGKTLSGAGTLRCYLWKDSDGFWSRSPDLDISLDSSHAGARKVTFPDQATFVANGACFYAADAITVSTGTTVTTEIETSTAPR